MRKALLISIVFASATPATVNASGPGGNYQGEGCQTSSKQRLLVFEKNLNKLLMGKPVAEQPPLPTFPAPSKSRSWKKLRQERDYYRRLARRYRRDLRQEQQEFAQFKGVVQQVQLARRVREDHPVRQSVNYFLNLEIDARNKMVGVIAFALWIFFSLFNDVLFGIIRGIRKALYAFQMRYLEEDKEQILARLKEEKAATRQESELSWEQEQQRHLAELKEEEKNVSQDPVFPQSHQDDGSSLWLPVSGKSNGVPVAETTYIPPTR